MWKKKGRKSQPGSNLEIIRENLNNMPMEKPDLLKEQLAADDDVAKYIQDNRLLPYA